LPSIPEKITAGLVFDDRTLDLHQPDAQDRGDQLGE
jgi:hypothetical protein